MTTVFGITNCDSVKKARKWLDQEKVDYSFFDFRKDDLNDELLRSFIANSPLKLLINKRSTTWKALSASTQAEISEMIEKDSLQQSLDNDEVQQLCATLSENPTLLKRPILKRNDIDEYAVGFSATQYQSLFSR